VAVVNRPAGWRSDVWGVLVAPGELVGWSPLQELEEECCDADVIELLPHRGELCASPDLEMDFLAERG
jgi:hypothetical protein